MDILNLEISPAKGVSIPEGHSRVTAEILYSRATSDRPTSKVAVTALEAVRIGLSPGLSGSARLENAANGSITIHFLAFDGTVSLTKRIDPASKTAAQAVLSKEEAAIVLAGARLLPAPPSKRTIPRRMRFLQTSLLPGSFDDFSVSFAIVASKEEWAKLKLARLFNREEPVSTSIEFPDSKGESLAHLGWQPAKLAVDGSFDADVPEKGGFTLLWWLQGPLPAIGSIAPEMIEASSKDKALPAVLPAFSSFSQKAEATAMYSRKAAAAMDYLEGCGRAGNVPRTPSEHELADNPQVYSEDPGSFCKPFQNPERVLSERSYFTILRVEQPEVSAKASALVLTETLLDLEETGSQKALVSLYPDGKLDTLKGDAQKKKVLDGKLLALDDGRTALDSRHPVQWEAESIRYQAASVARGHILEHRVRWRSNGYSLGTVAKTLTLAPRQARRIQKIEWERHEASRRAESSRQTDRVEDSVERERDYDDAVKASLREWSFGTSAAAAGGVAGGIGFFLEGVLGGVGAAGGGAGSAAYQENARNTSASEEQRLRDSIRRHADSLRKFESLVVTEVRQDETVTGTTEVIRNLNYAHSLTVIYYQILRHLRVETEFAGVSECLFVPFALKRFTLERAYRWRECIEKYLRAPRFKRAIRHLRDVLTDFSFSDIPEGARFRQRITGLRGSIYINMGIERPADTAQEDFSSQDWNVLRPILAEPAKAIHEVLFGMARNQRDSFYQSNYAGGIAANWCNELRLTSPDGEVLDADFTLASRYSFGGTVRVDFTVNPETHPALSRQALAHLVVRSAKPLTPGSFANVTRVSMTYTTDNFEYSVKDGGGTRDLIRTDSGAVDPAGAVVSMPLTPWEKVDQRLELRLAASELVDHLNEHLEYYHKSIWWSMDRDRLFMMIDGFTVPGTNHVSIASVVDREPIGIIGNSIVFRVSPGAFIGLGDIDSRAELYNLYANQQAMRDPLHISLPTDGLYAQSIMDPCPALEEHFGNTDWALNQPDLDPGTLAPSLFESRRQDPGPAAQPATMPATLINLQNAPEAPAPAGLQGVLNAVTKGDSFRDLTGLAGNQANALAALQAASSLATGFGNQAAGLAAAQLAGKAHATNTADQKIASINRAKEKALIDPAEATRQATEVLREMHSPKDFTRPHEAQPIVAAIHAATARPGSVVEANTAEGQVKVSLGSAGDAGPGTRDLRIDRDDPWAFEAEMLLANFDVAQSDLKAEHRTALEDLAEFVAERTAEGGTFRIRSITGHASTTGPETPSGNGFTGNFTLSERRAQNVLDHLRSLDILRPGELPAAISARGSLNPPVPTLLGQEHPLNRAVTIRFIIFDVAKAMAFEAGFRHWKINLDISVANLSGSLKDIAKHPTRPVSAGLKIGGKVDLGSIKNLENGSEHRVTIVSGYGGLGLGLTIPDEMLPIPPGPAGEAKKEVIRSAIASLLGLTAASVSLPQIAEGEFFTYKPVDFEWFEGRPVLMGQFNVTSFAGFEQTVLIFLDPDAPKGIGAITYMAGFVFAPLTYEASGTLHFGFVQLSS